MKWKDNKASEVTLPTLVSLPARVYDDRGKPGLRTIQRPGLRRFHNREFRHPGYRSLLYQVGSFVDMNRKRLGHQGIALIIVLWVLALLSVIALEFCFSMRTEVNITRNFKEESQLYFYAQGGVHRAIVELIYKSDPVMSQKRKEQKAEEGTPVESEWRL